jgi:hypothetical protein
MPWRLQIRAAEISANHPSFVEGGQRMRRVFQHREAPCGGDLEQRIQIARMPVEMDGKNALRSRPGGALDSGRIDAERIGLDVDEHRPRAEMLDDVGRRTKRHRGGDHLVARLNAEGREADLHGVGRRKDGERSRSADEIGERGFESQRLRSGRDPIRGQRIDDLLDLLGSDRRR